VGHLVEEAVAGDAGIVDQDIDGAELILDLLDGPGTVIERADIALDDGDAQFSGRGLGSLDIAGIAGGDGHAVFLQALNDRLADTAGSTRDESHSSHVRFLVPDSPV